ncbi:hypothetical protein AAIB41_11440 [Brucella sp. BE17]|uniref:hypothetical protein n=1 Tax=Brucella sp. BE17 TaxID=3142977 RepID=UPI0031BB1595
MEYMLAALLPLLFLASLFFLPNGMWKAGQTLKGNPEIRKKAAEARQSEVDRLNAGLINSIGQLKNQLDGYYQIEKIYKAIQYVIARHDWYETQRSVILGYVLTITGIVFAGITAYLATINDLVPERSLIIIASIGMTLTIGLFNIVHLYNKELDQDRPYRLIADIRHWFFRYSMPDKIKDYQGRMDYTNIAIDVISEKEKFFNRVMEVSSLGESVREDLEQLFILHILVKHKSESLQKMRSSFTFLVFFLNISAVYFFIYYSIIK